MSVMEMSHRSGTYQKIIDEAEADLRQLMGIPDNYKVLFYRVAQAQQFGDDSDEPDEKPRSGLHHNRTVGEKGMERGFHLRKGKCGCILRGSDLFLYSGLLRSAIDPDADYVYICENNTIYGTKFKMLPNTKGKPLVADVSSCFLSEPLM